MNQPSLGLLERLRPPIGFRTAGALGTTYSADLLTCMAVLTTMDGGDGEQIRYGRVEAYRALDRLRDRVRIYYNLGCLSRRDGRKYPSLALLDKVLAPVTVPGTGSFHPKVWLVRQTGPVGEDRFVLVVSSRNVTTSTDWDFGVAIQGATGGRGVALPRLRAFAEYVTRLGGDTAQMGLLGDLDAVRWELPHDVHELLFDFQEGGEAHRQLHPVWSTFPSRPSEVLLLSPFIDGKMVAEATRRWRAVEKRRLVAGTEGLTTVALGSRREELKALKPYQLTAASELGSDLGTDPGEQSEEEEEQARALHAKVVVLTERRKTTVVIGSNNLTSNGWWGGSTEAFVQLRGENSLAEALWEWADSQALLFEFPETGTPIPPRPPLEDEAERLRSARFRLEEPAPNKEARLVIIEPTALTLAEDMRLDVCRYTTPGQVVSFPSAASSVRLPGCIRAFRTRFVVCALHFGDEQIAWTTQVEIVPNLEDDRDRELVANLLGPRDFLVYLQSLRSAEAITGPPEGDEDSNPSWHIVEGSPRLQGRLSLEGLLRQLAEEPNTFAEMDTAISRYGELIKASPLPDDERSVLSELMDAWTVIREATLS